MPPITDYVDLQPFTEGTDVAYRLTFRDADTESLEDITDWEIALTVKRYLGQPDSEAVLQTTNTTHSDPTNGETVLEFSATDTADLGQPAQYWHRIDADPPSGTEWVPAVGRVKIWER